MDYLEYIIPDDFYSHLYFVGVAVFVIACLYASDNWNTGRFPKIFQSSGVGAYGYEENNGPATWHLRFPAAGGTKQSPINLQDRCSLIINSETEPLLKFSSDIHCPPSEMKIYNNGYTIAMYANWANGKRPTLFGGPLKEDYNFLNIRFRWGPNDIEGSEHMINSSKFAMELQAAFISEHSKTEDILQAARDGYFLMLSYLFMVTPLDNPYLEPIITSLKYVKFPMACLCIEPMVLSLLMPDFSRDYFTYIGSLTFPPCTEGVRWIVKGEPLMISSRQVRKFRKLCGCFGRIETNSRPIQKINGRELLYYD